MFVSFFHTFFFFCQSFSDDNVKHKKGKNEERLKSGCSPVSTKRKRKIGDDNGEKLSKITTTKDLLSDKLTSACRHILQKVFQKRKYNLTINQNLF
jgi:hypothetical protein